VQPVQHGQPAPYRGVPRQGERARARPEPEWAGHARDDGAHGVQRRAGLLTTVLAHEGAGGEALPAGTLFCGNHLNQALTLS
jgi:hypothetical protein